MAVVTSAGGPVDIIKGPDGFIYYVAINDGEVRQLRPGVVVNDQLLIGSKLLLKTSTDPAKRAASFSSKDIGISLGLGNGSGDDPVTNGGSVRIHTSAGCGGPCDTTYTLANNPPTEVWSYIGGAGANKGYKYKSKLTKFKASVQNGKQILVTLSGALGHDLQANPQPVDAQLTIGAHNYCLQFGGTTSFTLNKSFKAKNANSPAACFP